MNDVMKLIVNGKCIDNEVMFENVSSVTFGRIRNLLRNKLTGSSNICQRVEENA